MPLPGAPLVLSDEDRAELGRLSSAYPNAQMVHLPVHASWLNQVEVYFSVIQHELLTPDDFDDLDLSPTALILDSWKWLITTQQADAVAVVCSQPVARDDEFDDG